MRKLKKLVALMLVATMVLTPATMLAAESDNGATNAGGTINGEGEVEGYVDKDVFKVVLPTVSDVNFTLDPQGLLNVADSSKYLSTGGAVYFANNGGTFTDTSDAIEILNKSSYDIDVTFSVNVTLPDGISLAESKEALATATKPTVWLGMKEAEASTVTTLVSGANNYTTVKVDKVAENQAGGASGNGYFIKATASGSEYVYTYELGTGFQDSSADKASYTLTGACDTTADWTDVTDLKVTASVVWAAEKHEEITAPTLTFTNDGLVTISDLSANYTFSSLSLAYTANGTSGTYAFNTQAVTWSPAAPTASTTGTVSGQLNAAWVGLLSGTTPTVTLTYVDNTGESPVTKTVTATATFN